MFNRNLVTKPKLDIELVDEPLDFVEKRIEVPEQEISHVTEPEISHITEPEISHVTEPEISHVTEPEIHREPELDITEREMNREEEPSQLGNYLKYLQMAANVRIPIICSIY